VPGPKTPVTVVLKVGEDDLALAAVDRGLGVLAKRTAPNPPLAGAPYPALDTAHVQRWLIAALGDLGELFRVEAIVPTAFGATCGLVDGTHLVLAMMRPTAEPPSALREAFVAGAPDPDHAGLPTPANGASLALQLFWQHKAYPDEFARARWLLGHAAYWGFRLTDGVPATEAASLIEGGQLAEVAGARPTTLARRMGWQLLLPARRDAHRLLGRLDPDVAERTELPRATPVLVGTTPRAAAHALVLAAGYDRAAVLTAGAGGATLVTPGAGPVDATRRRLVSVDGRIFTLARDLADAASVAAELDAADGGGPVLIDGDWPAAAALAGARAERGQAVLRIDDADLWAKGGALLAHWGRRRTPARLALERVVADDCPPAGDGS
jgi:sugar (pentulose or hexulose) kinase